MPPIEQVICPVLYNKPFRDTQLPTVGAPMGQQNSKNFKYVRTKTLTVDHHLDGTGHIGYSIGIRY